MVANKVETECEPAVNRNKHPPNQTNSDNDSETKNKVMDPKIEKEKIIC